MDRRTFLKTTGAVGAGLGINILPHSPLVAAEPARGAPYAEKLGWRLGCQAWTFNRFPLFQAIDKVSSLGLHYIEVGPKTKFGADYPNVVFEEAMSAESRQVLKKKLTDSGVKLVSYGVAPLEKNLDVSRRTFEFAKDMGMETVVAEPSEDAFDTIEQLCEEYKINVALHNHPKPSHYWNPDTVLKVCRNRSKRIGACADTGHWMRSGIKPLEAVKKLEGRIIEFHFKDLNQFGSGGWDSKVHDVPWGTGAGHVKDLLAEVHRQKLRAVFLVEYEYHWDNNLPDILPSIAYFDKVAAELAAHG
jgi:sugar phosphate isomerase/epimerase